MNSGIQSTQFDWMLTKLWYILIISTTKLDQVIAPNYIVIHFDC